MFLKPRKGEAIEEDVEARIKNQEIKLELNLHAEKCQLKFEQADFAAP